MVTVTTKDQLKQAISNKQFPILCKGEIAHQLKRRKKISRAAKIGGAALAIGGIAAIPFTGGASAAATATGLTAMGLTIGAGGVAISTAELAILVGGGVAITGILKGKVVKLNPDGTVIVS